MCLSVTSFIGTKNLIESRFIEGPAVNVTLEVIRHSERHSFIIIIIIIALQYNTHAARHTVKDLHRVTYSYIVALMVCQHPVLAARNS